jgi:hypothetical protein
MLSTADAALFLGIAEGTMRAWRCAGIGPAFYSITARCVRYDRTDLQRYKSERRTVPSVRHTEGNYVPALQATA